MIKLVSSFSLARRKDPEEAWKYWTEIYAPNIMKMMPNLRRYIVNRVVKEVKNPLLDPSIGKTRKSLKWWGVSEQWFDNEGDAILTINTPIPRDDVWSGFLGEEFGSTVMEEYVVVNEPAPKIHCKRLGFMGLQEGEDPDEGWKVWKDVHAVIWKNTSPGIRRYVISRVIKAMPEPAKWWGLLEQWFDTEEDCERAVLTPRPSDNFGSYALMDYPFSGLAYVEEKSIII
jgi:hypothetical protein